MKQYEFTGIKEGESVSYSVSVTNGTITNITKKVSGICDQIDSNYTDVDLALSDIYKFAVNDQMNTYKRFIEELSVDSIEKYFKIEEVTLPKMI